MMIRGGENMNVLVVDDDKEIVESICIFLSGEGYKPLKAYDGMEALDILSESQVHLMILDIMMPRLDGIKTLMKLRESRNIPVILLSAKSEDADKILGLTAGADDYVTKPFNPSELMARVKSQLRRYTQLGSIGKQNGEIVIDGLCVNTESKTVKVDGEAVRLTPVEYKILELLVRNRGRVFSAEDIYSNVWNEQNAVGDNTIAVHVRHIREKIEINPKEPRYLKVVWGIGYKIE
jgi:DNA-binding response OmpR family regulator